MIVGLDSAYPPNEDQTNAALADGVRLWAGYIASKPGVGLLNPWSQADFDRVRRLGGTPIAYCSGWDDPAAVKALAAAWNVRLCLDIEDGIRGDGPWVQPFLDASGAGAYGNPGIPEQYKAPFKIAAAYLTSGDPYDLTWPPGYPIPDVPHGWQWAGTHDEYGISVDSAWLDDWFAPAVTPIPIEEDDMKWFTVLAPDGVTQWVITPQGFKFPLGDINDLEAIKATGQLITDSVDQGKKVTDAQLKAWPTLGNFPATGPATPPTVPPHTHPISLTGTTGAV